MALNFPVDTSAPYVDPTTGLKYVFNSAVGAWESALQPPVIVAAVEPQTAIEGFMWFNTSNNILYVYRSAAWSAVSTSTPSGADVRVSDTPEPLPSVGDLWWDTVSGQLFVYYTDEDGGSAWMPCSPTVIASSGSAYVSATAPPSQQQGDLWYNTSTTNLNVYDGAVWVVAQNQITGVATLTGTAPINVDNTDAANPVVSVAAATNSSLGTIRIGTQAEVNAGTETSVAITPSTLTAGVTNYLPTAAEGTAGIISLATQAEVDAGVVDNKAVTPETLSTSAAFIGLAVPTGAVISFAGISAPATYLICDGSAVSRTTYADLFAIIGTTYGAGDGSTTFNLPDLRGEFVRGFDNSRGVDSGRAFGSFQDDELRQHRHDIVTGEPGNALAGGGGREVDSGLTQTAFFGGTETRPRNVALNYIVKT